MAEFNKVNLNLLIELVRRAARTDIRGAWTGPLAAYWARLHYVGDVVDRDLRDSDFLKEPFHGKFRSMPPSDVELPENEPDGAFAVCPQETDRSPNVKIQP